MQFSIKSKLTSAVLSLGVAMTAFPATQAAAQDPFIGEIRAFGGNYCPRSWTQANGQLIAISSNTALFSLYGTTFGGDGRTTFGLPDLRSRSAMHAGNGPGLSQVRWGERIGSQQFSITNANQLPAHTHAVNATDAIGDKRGPGLDFLAKSSVVEDSIYHNGPANKVMDPGMIASTGARAPITHRTPALGMYYCVAQFGVYPSRN